MTFAFTMPKLLDERPVARVVTLEATNNPYQVAISRNACHSRQSVVFRIERWGSRPSGTM